MIKEGLFPRYPGRDYDFPVSRDYKLIVSCECTPCPLNKLNFCSMPSAIKISSGGKCQTGMDLIEEKNKTTKNEPGKTYYKHEGD